MKRILITEFVDEAALDLFGPEFEVRHIPELVENRSALLDSVFDIDAILVRNRTQVDAELLARAPQLKAVGRLGVGLDNIDLDTCRARTIAVLPATGANAASVAEYVVTTALALLRGAYFSNADIVAGNWPRARLGTGRELGGRTLGLVGFGTIARQAAALARGLGMEIAAHDPHIPEDDPAWADTRRCTLDELLPLADVISLHVPLLDSTRHLLDAAAIDRMKPDAVIINTARGGILDEAALVAALKEGRLGGAALDVFETEPVTAQSGARFRDVPNLILTPHIAGVTAEANVRVSRMTVENVIRALAED